MISHKQYLKKTIVENNNLPTQEIKAPNELLRVVSLGKDGLLVWWIMMEDQMKCFLNPIGPAAQNVRKGAEKRKKPITNMLENHSMYHIIRSFSIPTLSSP